MTNGRELTSSPSKRWARPSRMTSTAARSTNIGMGPAKPVLRYMPTYRLEPRRPLNREVCELIMKSVLDKALEEFTYGPKQAQTLCKQVSEEIKTRVKLNNFDRYKLVCIVTIGERFMQGYNSVANFLWDPEKDGYISYTFDTPKYFAVATLYYTYYD